MTKIDAATCERLIDTATEAAAKVCVAAPKPAPPSPSTADGLAAVADAIALATFGLAIIVAFATLGWFIYVRHRTREEAKLEVSKIAPAHIKAYLEEQLPGMVAEALAALTVSAGPAADETSSGADQGRALSEDAG